MLPLSVDAIRKQTTLWRQVKHSSSENLKEKFRRMKQSFENWVRRERKAYLSNIVDESGLRKSKA